MIDAEVHLDSSGCERLSKDPEKIGTAITKKLAMLP